MSLICPGCGGERILTGVCRPVIGYAYGWLDGYVFRPHGLRWFARMLSPRLDVQEPLFPCADSCELDVVESERGRSEARRCPCR